MPKTDKNHRDRADFSRVHGGWVFRATPRSKLRRIQGVSLAVAVALVSSLATGVAHASSAKSFVPDTDSFGDRLEPITQPYSDLYQLQWGLENTRFGKDVAAKKAWEVTKGEGTVAAVIDSGVDIRHADLAGQLLPGRNFDGGDANDITDRANHGTGVTALLVGREDGAGVTGVAPKSKVLPLKAITIGAVTEAIEYAVRKQVDVINISQTMGPSPRLESAIAEAADAGIPIVASAGNKGVNIDDTPIYPASYATTYPNVLAVTSMDIRGRYSRWANYGRRSVTLAAPGQEIVVPTAGGRWELATGTSYAAALVAGTIALMKSANPTYSPERIRDVLREMNVYESTLEANTLSRGFLNAATATRMASSEDPDGTTVTLRPRKQRDLAFQPANSQEADGTDGVKLATATEAAKQALKVTRANKFYHLETNDHYGTLAMRSSDARLRYFTPEASCFGVCTWKLRMQPDQRSFLFSPAPMYAEDTSFISIVGGAVAGASVEISDANHASPIELTVVGGRFGADSVASIHRNAASAYTLTAGRFVESLTMRHLVAGDPSTRWRFTWDLTRGAYRIGSWFDPNTRIVWNSALAGGTVTGGGGWEPNSAHLWVPWTDPSGATVFFNYYESGPGGSTILHRPNERSDATVEAARYSREVNRYVNDPLGRWSLTPEDNDHPQNGQIDGATVTLRLAKKRTTTLGLDSRSLPYWQNATEDPGQRFELRDYHGVAHQLVILHNYLTYENGIVRLTTQSDSVNTAWDLVPAGPDRRAYKIRHRQTGQYIASAAEPLRPLTMTHDPASAAEFDPATAGGSLPQRVYTIRPEDDARYVLEARSRGIENGAPVTLMPHTGGAAQKWYAKWDSRRGAYIFNIHGHPGHNLAWTSHGDKQIWLYGGAYDDQYWFPWKDRAGNVVISNYVDHNNVLTYRDSPAEARQLSAAPYDEDNHRQRWIFRTE